MLSPDRKYRPSSFWLDASALSGFVTEPFEKSIPTLVPSTLPQAGGFATARTGAFNLDELVSVSSAYTLVTARRESGSLVTLATAVVEDLNILQIVTARRIVAQLMVTYTPRKERKPGEAETERRISLAGSRFEGLRIAGHEHTAGLNHDLLPLPASSSGPELPLMCDSLLKNGQSYVSSLLGGGGAKREGEGGVQCPTDRHIVEIPGYGRIILGELLVTPDSVQLVSIRAELGCLVSGVVTITPCGGGIGGDR